MEWTQEAKLEALLRLPWTVQIEPTDDGTLVARAIGIDGAIAVGTKDNIEREFWDSLRATLSCFLEFNDPIPLPVGVKALPWDVPPRPRRTIFLVSNSSVAETGASGLVAAGSA